MPEIELHGKEVGLLTMKAMCKIGIIICLALQFAILHPFISLIIIFIGYFSLPSKYRTDRPYECFQSWFRLLLGFMIPVVLYLVFTGRGAALAVPWTAIGIFIVSIPDALFSVPESTLVLIALAFFTVFPRREEAEEGGAKIKLFLAGTRRDISDFGSKVMEGSETIGLVLFIVFMLFAFMQLFATTQFTPWIAGFSILIFVFGSWKVGKALGIPSKFSAILGVVIGLAFIVLSGIVITTFGGEWGWATGPLMIPMMAIFLLSWMMGLSSGREGRPYAGIFCLIFVLFAMSFQFTGTVGTIAFGAWWPTVYHYGSMVAEPIGAAWSSAAKSMEDLGLMMTCPSCYWAKQLQTQQVETGKVTSGGTTRSIELTNFEAINYMTATLEIDPSIPLVGSIELENQGEFTASWVNVMLDTPKIKNPEEVSAAKPGVGIYNLSNDRCKFTSCTGTTKTTTTNTDDTCKWDTESYPGDMKLMIFKCAEDGWSNLKNCECHDPSSGITTEKDIGCGSETKCGGINSRSTLTGGCECYGPNREKTKDIDCDNCGSSDCNDKCGEAIKVYKYGSWYLTIGFNYEFNYDANVSLPVEVMQQDIFEQRLLNKEIRLESKESQYTGGPVMVSLWTQKQPLRSGEESYGRISFINKGQGTVSDAELTLYIPNTVVSGISLTNPSYVSSSKLKEECKNFDSLLPGYKTVNCKLKGSLADGEYATLMFSFIYSITDPTIDTKSLIFIGDVNYNYKTSKSTEFKIMQAPPAQ